MKHLKYQVTEEVIIKKSRFITVITPIKNESDLLPIINELKKNYPRATHYCTAYVLGNNGEYAGSNDDGEPAGTAGVPMLEVLKQNNITNILAVIIRYYGGIQLGAGGLIRAYSNGVSSILKQAEFYQLIPATKYEVYFNYDQISDIDFLLKDEEILSKDFSNYVTYTVAITQLDHFEKIRHHFFEIKKLEEILLAR